VAVALASAVELASTRSSQPAMMAYPAVRGYNASSFFYSFWVRTALAETAVIAAMFAEATATYPTSVEEPSIAVIFAEGTATSIGAQATTGTLVLGPGTP